MTLFGDPQPRPVKQRPGRPEWSAIHTRQTCDQCRDDLYRAVHAGEPPADWPLTHPARWRHHTADGDRRLCYAHAQPLRDGIV